VPAAVVCRFSTARRTDKLSVLDAVSWNGGEERVRSVVELRFSAEGVPSEVVYDGRVWSVAAEPLHWFSRWNWWESRISVARGVGDVVSVEHWRLQVRLGSAGLRTFELQRDPRSPDWFLVAVTDD
jgi:hypothetical protein